MDIAKKISNLKDTIATAKAEKSLAKEKIEEIIKKLEKRGIKVEDLKDVIVEKKLEVEQLNKKIEEQIEIAENVLKSNTNKDK